MGCARIKGELGPGLSLLTPWARTWPAEQIFGEVIPSEGQKAQKSANVEACFVLRIQFWGGTPLWILTKQNFLGYPNSTFYNPISWKYRILPPLETSRTSQKLLKNIKNCCMISDSSYLHVFWSRRIKCDLRWSHLWPGSGISWMHSDSRSWPQFCSWFDDVWCLGCLTKVPATDSNSSLLHTVFDVFRQIRWCT